MQGRPALCQKLETLGGAGLPCFFSWKRGKRKNRQNPKRVVVILLILTERVYISGRVCGGCSAGVVPRGLRGAVREARYSPSRGPDDDRSRQPQDHQRHVWPRLCDIYLRQSRGPSTKRPPRSSPRWNARKPSGKKPGLKKQKISPSVLASCRYRGRFFVYLY